MKVVKKTKNYIYVELSDNDQDEVFVSSDLVRVDRNLIDKDYTLHDAIKCDNCFEEIEYPLDWVVKTNKYVFDSYEFHLPKDVDEILAKNPNYIYF